MKLVNFFATVLAFFSLYNNQAQGSAPHQLAKEIAFEVLSAKVIEKKTNDHMNSYCIDLLDQGESSIENLAYSTKIEVRKKFDAKRNSLAKWLEKTFTRNQLIEIKNKIINPKTEIL